ncbi:MAG: class I SAM-dependent methyltransferase [Anaerolineaceae bacterium]
MSQKSDENELKQEVSNFYNQIGWQMQDDGFYQNARYEDLRPVSHEYIHRCHMRVKRFLQPSGDLLLDAGSGPVQYPEYLTYSEEYKYRVCLDISIRALEEARHRLGTKGLYVVADVANLPFKADVFDGLVSLHTLHHIPPEQHLQAYQGFVRVLKPGRTGAVVNAWTSPELMKRWSWMVRIMDRVNGLIKKLSGHKESALEAKAEKKASTGKATGTYTQHITPDWLKNQLTGKVNFEILVWRSVSVRFLRAVIQPWLAGRFWLRLLYRNEELNPHFFGENGQYPLIVIRK